MPRLLLIASTVGLLSACAYPVGSHSTGTQTPADGHDEVTMAFAGHGSVRDWRPEDPQHVMLQDVHGQWFRATLQSPADPLMFTETLSFEPLPNGALGRFAALVVKGVRYPIVSLKRVSAPALDKPTR